MKKFMLLLLIPFLVCCSDDDDQVVVSLVGSWELDSVENEAVYDSPDDESIVITFEETEYSGYTEANEFGGDYEINRNRLYITNSYTSEIQDSEWGLLFYEALRKAYNEENERSEFYYTVEGENLTLRSEEEIMIFSRQ